MKIGILIDELAPGSAPKLIGQSVKGLKELGHMCEALVLVDNKNRERFPEVYNYHLSGIKIRYLFDDKFAWIRMIDFRFPGFSFFSLHHILSFFVAPLVMKMKEYDVIIAYCQYSSFAAWGLRLFRKIPYLLLVWDPSTYTLKKIYTKTWLKFFYPILYAFAYILDKVATRGAKAIITSGKLHHRKFKKISGKPLEDLYPGCFPEKNFVPYSNREKIILTYDRWDIGNKPNIFLDILENIDNNIKLRVGGFWHPENIKTKFLEEAKGRNLLNRIELLGPLDENNIIKLCSSVILHIHPNEEAFGMQTLEAAACGCSIIIPEGSGVTDLFQHGIQGYFPKKGSIDEIIKYTKVIFGDLERAEEMGSKAWEVAKNYTWPGYAKRLETITNGYIYEEN